MSESRGMERRHDHVRRLAVSVYLEHCRKLSDAELAALMQQAEMVGFALRRPDIPRDGVLEMQMAAIITACERAAMERAREPYTVQPPPPLAAPPAAAPAPLGCLDRHLSAIAAVGPDVLRYRLLRFLANEQAKGRLHPHLRDYLAGRR